MVCPENIKSLQCCMSPSLHFDLPGGIGKTVRHIVIALNRNIIESTFMYLGVNLSLYTKAKTKVISANTSLVHPGKSGSDPCL